MCKGRDMHTLANQIRSDQIDYCLLLFGCYCSNLPAKNPIPPFMEEEYTCLFKYLDFCTVLCLQFAKKLLFDYVLWHRH